MRRFKSTDAAAIKRFGNKMAKAKAAMELAIPLLMLTPTAQRIQLAKDLRVEYRKACQNFYRFVDNVLRRTIKDTDFGHPEFGG